MKPLMRGVLATIVSSVRSPSTMVPSLLLAVSQLATSVPVTIEVACDACGLPMQDMHKLEQWLSRGLEQNGHPSVPAWSEDVAAIRVLLRLEKSTWQIDVMGPTRASAIVAADEFDVASLEALHMAEELITQSELSPPASQSAATEPEPTLLEANALPPNKVELSPLPTDIPSAIQDATPTSESHSDEDSVWEFRPRANAGVVYVNRVAHYSFGLGSTIARQDRLGLATEVQFAQGTPVPWFVVRDYSLRLMPTAAVVDADLVELELGLWFCAVIHTSEFEQETVASRLQSVLGLPVTLWFHTGFAELGARGYLQVNPGTASDLTNPLREPFELGIDFVVGVEP